MPVTVSKEIFRQYDVRGLVAEDFTPEVVEMIGRAMAMHFVGQQQDGAGPPRVVVGRDNRLSSDSLNAALVAGLTAMGADVVDLGTVITPAFYFARLHLGIDCGAMITGSHNPPEYNGLKIARGPGTIYGDEIQSLGEVARRIAQQAAVGGGDSPSGPAPGSVTYVDIQEAYLQMLCERIQLGPRRLKVAVDCGNGTASLFAVEFLERLGCEVVPLYCTSDGRFPNHHPDPVHSANLEDLRRAVVERRCDVGVAYDGDADRIGVVDDSGRVIWGDTLMILYWREILPRHPGTPCIIEVKCSQALVDEVKRLGGKPIFYKTGHSLIKAKMRELGAVFTGEMSGHMFFADEYFGYDDALYATGRLLRILSNAEAPLSQLMADVPRYHSTAETRVGCPDRDKFAVVVQLTERFRKEREVIDVDGARVLFPGGWGLVRASNTQPVIVARCEGRTPEDLQAIAAEMKAALESFPSVEPFEWEY